MSSFSCFTLPRFAAFAASVLAALGTSAVHAQTYDAFTDFSTTNNPNGVWRSGYTDTLGSSLVLYTQFTSGTFQSWRNPAVTVSGAPEFARNLGPQAFGVPTNFLTLHPGSANQYSVLRFTTAITGTYNVSAQFFVGDSGDTDANILRNSNAATPVYFAATTNTNPLYTGTLNLAAGETLDFVVGSKGNYSSDSTPIRITITGITAAPEPGGLALVTFGGFGLVGCIALRRRTYA